MTLGELDGRLIVLKSTGQGVETFVYSELTHFR